MNSTLSTSAKKADKTLLPDKEQMCVLKLPLNLKRNKTKDAEFY